MVQIPWQEDMRALYAVAYPGGPSEDFSHSVAAAVPEDSENILEGAGTSTATRAPGSAGERRHGGRRDTRERGKQSKQTEGCIVVAASDETVRFHEVWSETRRGVLGWRGVLGGSDILEGLEGIEKDGAETIR